MRNSALRIIVLLTILTASVILAPAADKTLLVVKVSDEHGKPVDRANVRVVFQRSRSPVNLKKSQRSWELKTGQDGTGKFPGIPKGDILIQVTGKYYQSFGDTFTVEEDNRTVEVTLKPPQKQFSSHGELKQ